MTFDVEDNPDAWCYRCQELFFPDEVIVIGIRAVCHGCCTEGDIEDAKQDATSKQKQQGKNNE